MKKNILICFFLMLINNNVFSQFESHYPKYDSLTKIYKIIDIKQINKAYLVSVIDKDSYKFTIVTLKNKSKGERKDKIKIGEEYNLLFYSIYPPPEENIILIGGDVIKHNFHINGIQIKFQGNFNTGILVTTPDLKGLYYIKP